MYKKLTVKFVMEVGSGSIIGISVSGTTALLLSFTMIFNVIKEFLDTTVSFGYSNENSNSRSIYTLPYMYIL